MSNSKDRRKTAMSIVTSRQGHAGAGKASFNRAVVIPGVVMSTLLLSWRVWCRGCFYRMISLKMSSTLRSALRCQYEQGKDNARTLQLLLRQVILVLIEIEEFFWNSLCRWLILRVMVRLQVRVSQGLFNSDALDRVECK